MKTRIELCPKLQRRLPIYIEDILWLEGNGNYTMVHLQGGKKILTCKTLMMFGKLLPSNTFLRVNKSQLISTKSITDWKQSGSRSLNIQLSNGEILEVSRRRICAVKAHLNVA